MDTNAELVWIMVSLFAYFSSLIRQLLRHVTMVSKFLAPVVQTMDSAIHRGNRCPEPLNNWGLDDKLHGPYSIISFNLSWMLVKISGVESERTVSKLSKIKVLYYVHADAVAVVPRELKQRRRRRQRERQKSNRFLDWQNKNSARCITLFCKIFFAVTAIGLDWQNKNSARASRFFVHFFLPSLHAYDVKLPNFAFLRRNWKHPWQRFSFREFRYSPLEFNSWKKSPAFDKF